LSQGSADRLGCTGAAVIGGTSIILGLGSNGCSSGTPTWVSSTNTIGYKRMDIKTSSLKDPKAIIRVRLLGPQGGMIGGGRMTIEQAIELRKAIDDLLRDNHMAKEKI
jgi:hypothetical protein